MTSFPHRTLRWSRGGRSHIRKPTKVTSGPCTQKRCMLSRRVNADSFRSATEKIVHAVRQILKGVGGVLKRHLNVAF